MGGRGSQMSLLMTASPMSRVAICEDACSCEVIANVAALC